MEYLIIRHNPTGEYDRITRTNFNSLSNPWEYTVINSEWE